MELEASLPWLALTMTSGDSGSIVGAIAARIRIARGRILRELDWA
jgi:hypothetical protein